MTLRRKVLFSGAVLFALGGLILLWYVVKRHSGDGGWQITIEGNQILGEKELQDVVLYLLRSAKDGVSADEIRQALLLNPRIAAARVAILPARRIRIAIEERRLEYLENEGHGMAEKDATGTMIAENVSQLHRDLTPDKVVFYLTFRDPSADKPRSDIIRLWRKTRERYAFLWQRVSEIGIQRVEGQSAGSHSWRYRIFSAGLRSCVVHEGDFTEETLRRLWAVYAYLETQLPRAVTLVDLQENSAIVREMKVEYGKEAG